MYPSNRLLTSISWKRQLRRWILTARPFDHSGATGVCLCDKAFLFTSSMLFALFLQTDNSFLELVSGKPLVWLTLAGTPFCAHACHGFPTRRNPCSRSSIRTFSLPNGSGYGPSCYWACCTWRCSRGKWAPASWAPSPGSKSSSLRSLRWSSARAPVAATLSCPYPAVDPGH